MLCRGRPTILGGPWAQRGSGARSGAGPGGISGIIWEPKDGTRASGRPPWAGQVQDQPLQGPGSEGDMPQGVAVHLCTLPGGDGQVPCEGQAHWRPAAWGRGWWADTQGNSGVLSEKVPSGKGTSSPPIPWCLYQPHSIQKQGTRAELLSDKCVRCWQHVGGGGAEPGEPHVPAPAGNTDAAVASGAPTQLPGPGQEDAEEPGRLLFYTLASVEPALESAGTQHKTSPILVLLSDLQKFNRALYNFHFSSYKIIVVAMTYRPTGCCNPFSTPHGKFSLSCEFQLS